MAKPVSTEELQFRKRARRRLIGAITLAVVAVVVLPMVLDREPEPLTQAVDVRIPAKDKVPPLPEPPPAPPTPPAAPEKPAPAEKAATAPTAPPKPAPSAKAPEPAAKSPAPTAKSAAPAQSAPQEAFVVQLGAFASADNARQLKERLEGSGMRAYTETVTTAQGKQTRVRAGPYPTREAAEKALAQVKQLGLDGIVTTR
jgi:DedD protein